MKPSRPLLLCAALLLGACDPIQIEVVLPPPVVIQPGSTPSTMVDAGHPPDTSTPDGGHPPDGSTPDAGYPPDGSTPDAGTCEGGWTTRELAKNAGMLAFTFDSAAVGHFALMKDLRIYVGTTRPGEVPVPAGDLRGYARGIAVDAAGRRHLLLSDSPSSTYYAREQEGSWLRTLVAPDSHPVTLKLDASGFAHAIVSLGTSQNRRLGYATNRSGQWVVTDLGLTARNASADLALDSQGHAHIAWLSSSDTEGVYYGTNASGTWMTERALAASGNEPVIALDPQDRPHLLYSWGGSSAEHLTKQDGTWTRTYVGPANGIALDLVADKNGNLHALLDRSQNPKIVYATLAAGSRTWSYTPIISLNGQGGVTHPWEYVLGLDAQGQVHAGYWYIISTDEAGISGDYVRYAQPCP